MSWEDYVNYLKAGNVVSEVFIANKQGLIYASSFGLLPGKTLVSYKVNVPDENDPDQYNELDYSESENFVYCANNSGVSLHQAGLRINQKKYQTVCFDGQTGSWYLKREKGGACIVITEKLILFGSFDQEVNMENGQPQNASVANKRVEALGSLLTASGF